MPASGPVPTLSPEGAAAMPAHARRSTRAFYEANAEQYAQATLSQSMRPQLDRFLCLAPDGVILDLGCGAGRDLKEMIERDRAAVGLDLSLALTQKARSVARAPVVVGDLRAPPIGSLSLAGLWASASLLHLPAREVAAALVQAHRMLRPGGVMFSSVKAGAGARLDPDGRWFMLHSSGDWADLVQMAGLQVIAVEEAPGASTSHRIPETWINCFAVRR